MVLAHVYFVQLPCQVSASKVSCVDSAVDRRDKTKFIGTCSVARDAASHFRLEINIELPFVQTKISFYQNTTSTRKKTPECDDRDHQVFHFFYLLRLDIRRLNPFSFIAMLSAFVINYFYSH